MLFGYISLFNIKRKAIGLRLILYSKVPIGIIFRTIIIASYNKAT